MDTLQVVVLSLVQGLTEFLPISSSGHLILLPVLVEWKDHSVAFDVAVHVGTLIAVVVYFRRDLRSIISDWFVSIVKRRQTGQSMLGWAVLVGTIPGGLCGLILNAYGHNPIRTPTVIAAATIIFGLMLWWADARRQAKQKRTISHLVGCNDNWVCPGSGAHPGYFPIGGDHHRGACLGTYPQRGCTLFVSVIDSHYHGRGCAQRF